MPFSCVRNHGFVGGPSSPPIPSVDQFAEHVSSAGKGGQRRGEEGRGEGSSETTLELSGDCVAWSTQLPDAESGEQTSEPNEPTGATVKKYPRANDDPRSKRSTQLPGKRLGFCMLRILQSLLILFQVRHEQRCFRLEALG